MTTRNMTRKEFLQSLGMGGAALFCAATGCTFLADAAWAGDDIAGHVFRDDAPKAPWKWSKEGYHYTTDGRVVQCQVCPNRCLLNPGDRSICRSKVNIGGKLYSLAYGNPCSVHADPVEKKPLYHFYPGSMTFSIATTGCNFRCLNCQNWEISQKRPEEVDHGELFPDQVVEKAISSRSPAIAYTYAEPVTFYEYVFDTSKAARAAGLKNVLVSNGYINKEPLVRLCAHLDAANINLKSFDDHTYRTLNGGRLAPVLETFKTLHDQGVWFEMTTLVVPTYVDRTEMIKEMCGWILQALGPDYPLHFLRFFPRYRLNRLPPTPVKTLEGLRDLAFREGIHHVYLGNVPGHEGVHTYCHGCKKILLERKGYLIAQNHVASGRCAFCGTPVPGRWT